MISIMTLLSLPHDSQNIWRYQRRQMEVLENMEDSLKIKRRSWKAMMTPNGEKRVASWSLVRVDGEMAYRSCKWKLFKFNLVYNNINFGIILPFFCIFRSSITLSKQCWVYFSQRRLVRESLTTGQIASRWNI